MQSAFRSGPSGHLADPPADAPRGDAFGMPRAVLLWALVLAVTMLSFYVHLINEQMARAHAWQQTPPAALKQASRGAVGASATRAQATAQAGRTLVHGQPAQAFGLEEAAPHLAQVASR